MTRSVLARSIEPLVNILWALFLVWTAWVAAVWIVPIGATSLGFSPDNGRPSHAELRAALLLMARHADIVWLALAVTNLHLIVAKGNGLQTARLWLSLTAVSALILGIANSRLGMPFGWMQFGETMGPRVSGVPIGWLLFSTALVIGARETALSARPRASHSTLALMTAALVLLTIINIEWPARFVRGWWWWYSSETQNPVPFPWRSLIAWVAWPGLIAFAMREKVVSPGNVNRSVKPAVMLGLLNGIAIAARLCAWFRD